MLKLKNVIIHCIVFALFLSACTISGPKNDSKLADYTTLTGLLGTTKEELCNTLNINSDDLKELEKQSGIYETPLTAQYAGVDFSVIISFDRFSGKLWHIQYVADYEGLTEQSAKDIVAVARSLVETYGEPVQGPYANYGAHTIEDQEIPEVYEYILKGKYSEGYLWRSADGGQDNINRYIESVSQENNSSASFNKTLSWKWEETQNKTTVKIAWYVGL